MANIKSAAKRARQSEKRRQHNVARKSAIKTAVRKVVMAIEANELTQAREFLRDAESRIARARGKDVLHRNTASRKISRLAQQLAAAERAA